MVTAVLQCIGASVREVHPHDVSAIMAIETVAFETPLRQSEMVAIMRDYRNMPLVLERGGRILAYCIVEDHKNSFQVRRIASAYRLCGFGRALVSAVQRRCIQDGKSRIDVLLPERDVESQVFFSRVGFQWVQTIHADYGDKYLLRQLRGQR